MNSESRCRKYAEEICESGYELIRDKMRDSADAEDVFHDALIRFIDRCCKYGAAFKTSKMAVFRVIASGEIYTYYQRKERSKETEELTDERVNKTDRKSLDYEDLIDCLTALERILLDERRAGKSLLEISFELEIPYATIHAKWAKVISKLKRARGHYE